MKRTIIILTVTLLAALITWLYWPYLVVASLGFSDKKGEESSRRACDRIVAAGPRTVPYIISSIEANSPYLRRYCYLPIALKELGSVAHAPLIQAIEQQPDIRKKAYLVSTLQTAFSDFRYLHLFLNAELHLPSLEFLLLSEDIRQQFPEAPPLILEDRTINPDFIAYWKRYQKRNTQTTEPNGSS